MEDDSLQTISTCCVVVDEQVHVVNRFPTYNCDTGFKAALVYSPNEVNSSSRTYLLVCGSQSSMTVWFK